MIVNAFLALGGLGLLITIGYVIVGARNIKRDPPGGDVIWGEKPTP